MFSLQRPCAICGNDLFEASPGAKLHHICRCRVCETVQVRTLPGESELREIYGEGYFQSEDSARMGYADYAADRDCIVRTAHRRLSAIERHAPDRGCLLDVGCALGFFMSAARERGWNVQGVDISAHAAGYARETLGLDARCGMLEEAGFEPRSFDVLTLWDVIEHVHDPVATLSACAGLLKDGGLLVLSTPDIGSRVAKVTGPRWMGFKLAEEHLYYFSRRTMALALEKAGFEILDESSVGKHIALGFFAERLELYAGPLARALGRALSAAKLSDRAVYVNPRDIMCITARKRR